MTDTSNTGQQPSAGTPVPASVVPSHDQLAALGPFQNQLTWVGTEQFARGQQDGAKKIAEQLGMTVDEAVAKLKGTQPPVQDQGQQQQGQSNPDLERRIAELEQRQTKLDERESKLTTREAAIQVAEQDGLRITALEALGMTRDQAQSAKAMLQLPQGVTEMTAELAKASAEQLKTMFPGLFPTQQGDGQQQQQQSQQTTGQPAAGGPPPSTHTAGTQQPAGGGATVSAEDRAKSRLTARGHVKPATS